MDYIIALGFDFSPDKFASPLFIVGAIVLVLSIFLVAGSAKLDEYLYRRRKAKLKASLEAVESDRKDDDVDENGESEDIENTTHGYKKATAIDDNVTDDAGELSMFKRKDGSMNYFYIFKFTGLILVIVSALMIVFGLR